MKPDLDRDTDHAEEAAALLDGAGAYAGGDHAVPAEAAMLAALTGIGHALLALREDVTGKLEEVATEIGASRYTLDTTLTVWGGQVLEKLEMIAAGLDPDSGKTLERIREELADIRCKIRK